MPGCLAKYSVKDLVEDIELVADAHKCMDVESQRCFDISEAMTMAGICDSVVEGYDPERRDVQRIRRLRKSARDLIGLYIRKNAQKPEELRASLARKTNKASSSASAAAVSNLKEQAEAETDRESEEEEVVALRTPMNSDDENASEKEESRDDYASRAARGKRKRQYFRIAAKGPEMAPIQEDEFVKVKTRFQAFVRDGWQNKSKDIRLQDGSFANVQDFRWAGGQVHVGADRLESIEWAGKILRKLAPSWRLYDKEEILKPHKLVLQYEERQADRSAAEVLAMVVAVNEIRGAGRILSTTKDPIRPERITAYVAGDDDLAEQVRQRGPHFSTILDEVTLRMFYKNKPNSDDPRRGEKPKTEMATSNEEVKEVDVQRSVSEEAMDTSVKQPAAKVPEVFWTTIAATPASTTMTTAKSTDEGSPILRTVSSGMQSLGPLPRRRSPVLSIPETKTNAGGHLSSERTRPAAQEVSDEESASEDVREEMRRLEDTTASTTGIGKDDDNHSQTTL